MAEVNLVYSSTNLLDVFRNCFGYSLFNCMVGSIKDYLSPIFSIYFSIAILLFVISQLLQYFNSAPLFVSSYLDDIVVIPIILPIVQVLLRIIQKNQHYQLDFGMVLTTVLLLTIVFEIILPRYSTRYTSDYWDVFCYSLGALFYWKFQNKPN